MVDVLPDELGVPMTVDDYTKQLRELQCIYFPEAELLPGMLRLITCARAVLCEAGMLRLITCARAVLCEAGMLRLITCAELCCVKQVLIYQQLLVCVCLCVGMCKQN